MEFPRLVYKSASTHKLVANADEHAAALNDGWYASVPESQGLRPVPTPGNPYADVERRIPGEPRRQDFATAVTIKGKRDKRRLVNRREADKTGPVAPVFTETPENGTKSPWEV